MKSLYLCIRFSVRACSKIAVRMPECSCFVLACCLMLVGNLSVYKSHDSSALIGLPAWLGGFIAISIISFLSLLGVILVPLMNRVFFKFLLSFLVALAVGTLSGDALLHLLPHVSSVICPSPAVFYPHTLKVQALGLHSDSLC